MEIYTQLWFWMIIVSLIAIAFGIYIYSVYKNTITGVPWWGYFFLIVGAALLILGLFISVNSYYQMYVEDSINEVREYVPPTQLKPELYQQTNVPVQQSNFPVQLVNVPVQSRPRLITVRQ